MNKIIRITRLGFPWATQDPFLFCAYHRDLYPKGKADLSPDASLEGRNLGEDFVIKDGWRMYHGQTIPGFPYHPHRGFETITIAKEGTVDHSDSLGAAGRFSNGDVQWMTAGKGVQHSEMFPMLHQDKENPLEIFQIWLNLPRKNKLVDPHFSMLWSEDIIKIHEVDQAGRKSEITLVTGHYKDAFFATPAPDSWAAKPENDVAVWTIEMQAGASITLPSSIENVGRTLYFYTGDVLTIEGQEVAVNHSVELISNTSVELKAGKKSARILVLQGKPINEPVAQYGPFVMNTEAEIQQAFKDYQATQFGGWPWPKPDNVHDKDKGRFAIHTDGKEEWKS